MTVAILLVVIVALLCTRQADRDYVRMLLIGAFLWLAIEIRLLRILVGLFALALEHWIGVVMALSAAVLLIVPAIMIYILVRDQIDNRVTSRGLQESGSAVRRTFEQRGETLMALGYGRTQTEVTAVREMKKDLHPQSGKPASKHEL